MEEKELKSLKLSLDYEDVNGKLGEKVFTVKVGEPKKEKGMHKITLTKDYNLYSLSFSMVLPDHMHETLKGAHIAANELYGGFGKDMRTYGKDLSKTIRSHSLEGLTKTYTQYLYDYRWLKSRERAQLTKVIFYHFNLKSSKKKSEWDSTDFGKQINIEYAYTVGYISEDKTRYSSNKNLINEYRDRGFYNDYKYVTWTEERENFFIKIEEQFEKLISQLTNFEENLTDDKIELLMLQSTNLLGA